MIVFFIEFVELRKTGKLWRQRIGFKPSTVCITKKIITRSHTQIHISFVETRFQIGLCKQRANHESSHKQNFQFHYFNSFYQISNLHNPYATEFLEKLFKFSSQFKPAGFRFFYFFFQFSMSNEKCFFHFPFGKTGFKLF